MKVAKWFGLGGEEDVDEERMGAGKRLAEVLTMAVGASKVNYEEGRKEDVWVGRR